jgi:hypothetical protein
MEIITNHVPRDVVDAWELPASQRAEFDYLDWAKIEAGEESASFIKYRGEWYDLGDFMTTRSPGVSDVLGQWDGYISDSFFSGIVVKYADSECETVIVGTYYS